MYEERFAEVHGPLRPVVERVFRAFLTCGLVERGIARAWCETCRLSYLIPYSCRGRSFCPSCEKKRSVLWAEWLQKEVLAPVPHRHVVMTMPRLLRGIFRKRRELLLDLSQCGAEALAEDMRREVGADKRPGIVVSIATAGDLFAVARPPARPRDRRRVLRRGNVPPSRDMGPRGPDAALPPSGSWRGSP